MEWAGVLSVMHDLAIAREGLHYVGDTIWTKTSSWKEIEDYCETCVSEMWNYVRCLSKLDTLSQWRQWSATPALDLSVIKDDVAQVIDFSADTSALPYQDRALPTVTCDFTVMIVAVLVKLHLFNYLCDLLFGTVSKFIWFIWRNEVIFFLIITAFCQFRQPRFEICLT